MKTLILALLLTPAAYAESSLSTGFDDTSQPLKTNSVLSGAMLTNETELLTPQGIIDTPAPLSLTSDLISPTIPAF